MKRIIILVAAVALFSGCASTETIKRLETQSGHGMYTALADTQAPAPAGYGDLQLSLSLKTRNPGSVLMDTTDYGTERYSLLVGISGQTLRLTGARTPESGDYHGSSDPEAGNGVRYHFTATLRLPVGSHRITVALPGDGVVLEHDVTVHHGMNRLELKPVYGMKSSYTLLGFRGERTYYEGVTALVVSGQSD
ncbi:hypothetical protein [Trichlorobacter ammonificans]|uniref:Lipoprotein n=1 Tax=Trichlorobacter ammonificans TaxID=2916410 RepID=A0ABM9D4T0_9BACT|nr:hypothetical protein [Trichlorobacter ammonificans]CAH2030259.1 conserved exported protein of unknown function [Trichlorobacter ammonificans]